MWEHHSLTLCFANAAHSLCCTHFLPISVLVSVLTFVFLLLRPPRSLKKGKKVRSGQLKKTRRSDRGCDEQMQIGDTREGGGDLTVFKLDDEKEGMRKGSKDRRGGRTSKGGGAFIRTGMNMTQRQQPEPLLLSSLHTNQEHGWGGGITVSMTTAEQQ